MVGRAGDIFLENIIVERNFLKWNYLENNILEKEIFGMDFVGLQFFGKYGIYYLEIFGKLVLETLNSTR